MQEKWRSLGKNRVTWHFKLALFSPSTPQFCGGLKNQPSLIMVKTGSCGSHWRGQKRVGAPSKLHSQKNCHYLTCVVVSWKTPLTWISYLT